MFASRPHRAAKYRKVLDQRKHPITDTFDSISHLIGHVLMAVTLNMKIKVMFFSAT